MKHSYSAGTLLWIDDDFAYKEYDPAGGELDAWRVTFGNVDNRVYRLLGLELVTAVSLKNAEQILEELTRPKNSNRFIQAVVDLRIPYEGVNRADAPEMKNGLMVALMLQEYDIPFYFLSSSSDAMQELTEEKLDRIPYYQKNSAPALTMMPEPLARQILSEFRNHITWLDIEPLVSSIADGSSHPLQGAGEERSFFPFLGSYRDFVERWETRSMAGRHKMYVLRAPESHSDAFVMQCILIMMSGTSGTLGNRKIIYLDASNYIEFQRLKESHAFQDHNQVVILRISGDRPDNATAVAKASPDQVEEMLHAFRHFTVYAILPVDEGADPFLRLFSKHHFAVYDDLPVTRLYDRQAREELVRRSCEFIMQKVRLPLGGREPKSLHSIYLRHPEILINPIDWTFLMEAGVYSVDLDDPFEILRDLFITKNDIEKAPGAVLDKLAEGKSIDFSDMFFVAREAYASMNSYHNEWREKTLHDWLTQSWQYPYGVINLQLETLSDSERELWEDSCLDVLVALASEYMEHRDCRPVINSHDPESSLDLVCQFLNHQAIQDMIAQKDTEKDWEGLESFKWPHLKYPMPAALNRRLLGENRYLFVQTEFLDRATILPSGRRELLQLEARAQGNFDRLSWIDEALPHLPLGWQESISILYNPLIERRLQADWNDPKQREVLWKALRALLRNSAPSSYIFYQAWEAFHAGKTLASDTVTSLRKVQGQGVLLNKIRGKRRKLMAGAFQIIEPQHRVWFQGFEEAHDGLRFLDEFRKFKNHSDALANLNKRADLFLGELLNFTLGVIGKGKENQGQKEADDLPNQLFKLVFDPAHALHVEDIYHDKFSPALENNSVFCHGTMRGTPTDIYWIILNTLGLLKNTLQPLVFLDGYHFLSLIYDLRNTLKGSVPQTGIETIQTLFEFYVLGLEGLCTQLAGCLYASGHADLAEKIPNHTFELSQIPKDVKGMEDVFRVQRNDNGTYEVFTLGIPGKNAVGRYAYDAAGEKIVFFDESVARAAE